MTSVNVKAESIPQAHARLGREMPGRGVDGGEEPLLAFGASPRPADGSHLPAASAAAEEPVAAIGLEPRHARSRRHLEPLQNLSGLRIEPPHFARVTFPGTVP
jgi:hypothetical protein